MRRISIYLIALLTLFCAYADVPAGYYHSLVGKTGQDLKDAVHALTKNHTKLSYNSLWYYYYETDYMPNNRNQADLKQIAEYPFPTLPEELLPGKAALQQHIKTAQFAVICIGRMPQEGRDRTLENGYQLTETEITLIREVCAAYHKWGKKVFVVLNVEGMVHVADWVDYPDAILYAGHAGQAGPTAVRDIITGKVNPSGKLTSVWPKQYRDIPSSHYFPDKYQGKPRPAKVGNDYPATGYMFVDEVPYTENFRIGYRYFDEHQEQVQYPFGYGLSYTMFAYDKLKVDRTADSVLVQVRVTNTGKVAGMESVQLYVSPQRKNLHMEKPLKEMYPLAGRLLCRRVPLEERHRHEG